MTTRFSYGVSGGCGYSGGYGYSYGVIATQQAAHSREASRHSAMSHPSYPPSIRSRKRTSTDEQHPRFDPSPHAHTRESSAVGRASVEDERTQGHRRRHPEVRHSEEARRRSYDYQKHNHHPHQTHLCVPDTHHQHHTHHLPHCHHAHHRCDAHARALQYSNSPPIESKFPGLAQNKVVAVRSKSNDMTWQHRISQSMGLAKAKEHDRPEEKVPAPAVQKVKVKKKKNKWKWWGKKKKDPVDLGRGDASASKHKEPEIEARPESRSGMLEWLGGESLPVQSPKALKELFEQE